MKTNRLSVCKSLLVGMLGCVSLCSMSAYGQEVIYENRKMLGSRLRSDDEFGFSVAIGDGFIAVGVPFDNTAQGTDAGSVYLFDAETGFELSRIVPPDGERLDRFGWAVAIDNGILAVSATQPSLNDGVKNGKIYLYDLDTGALLRIIIGADFGHPNNMARLGNSIAMHNGTIAATADEYSTDGMLFGAAYLFDASTGAEIHKLITGNGGNEYDGFGRSVSMHNGLVAVGAHLDGGNGIGAAYLFDAETGSELFRFIPFGEEPGTSFGESVAVGDRFVAVGTRGFVDGKVHLFDIETGELVERIDLIGESLSISNGVLAVGNRNSEDSVHLISLSSFLEFATLEPSDSLGMNDQFGFSIAGDNGTFVIGANEDDDEGFDAGAAYLYKGVPIDTDSDGLLDDWEINGIPYTDINGAEQRFMLPDADPEHKDIYVEMDTMSGISTGSSLDSDLTQAFALAPVGNPDGFDGIAFHLLQDDSSITHIPQWLTDGCWPLDFADKRSANYGTALERSNESAAALLEAKAMAYRYCIVADQALPDNIGGCGMRPGDNFVLFLGSGAYTDIAIAADFMHELGHNFGLDHGGGDGINGKPNYPSVMNYILAYKYNWNQSFWRLDYSRRGYSEFEFLEEEFLDETVGVGQASGLYSDFLMPFGYNELAGPETIRKVGYVRLDGSATDFGMTDDTGFLDGVFDLEAQQDLNYAVNTPAGVLLPGVPSPNEVFEPYNDWINVHLKLAAANGASAPTPSFATDELTNEAREWIDTNFPAPPSICQADLTGEGVLDFFDVSAFLQGFANQDPIADFTDDGIWDFFDVSAFLQAFAAGCP